MRQVKSKETTLEKTFRKALWLSGVRYRKNNQKAFGRPDLMIKKARVVVFIDSCFWHGCSDHCRVPSTNKLYWINKIERNKKRDIEVTRYYKNINWRVLRIWEHDANSTDKFIEKIKS